MVIVESTFSRRSLTRSFLFLLLLGASQTGLAQAALPATKGSLSITDSEASFVHGRRAIFPERLWDSPGSVTVGITVGVDGQVENAEVLASADSRLNSYALDAVEQWRYDPARRDGNPIESRLDVTIDFHTPLPCPKDAAIGPVLVGGPSVSVTEAFPLRRNGTMNCRSSAPSSQDLAPSCVPPKSASQTWQPKNGFVADATTAIAIAEAVLIPVYGKETIESERPFKVTLQNGVWTAEGTLHCRDGKGGVTAVCDFGGTAEVRISKADGRILSMIHYK
jgi:TonB family protein